MSDFGDFGILEFYGCLILVTSAPFDTPRLMSELVEWYNQWENIKNLHPLLVIAIFTVVFLAIHPFQDGNGRLSRVITNLLLLRSGYNYVPYASLESIIEENKDLYYLALRKTQSTIRTSTPDWHPWVIFFLKSLLKQKKRLEKKFKKSTS